MSDISELFKRIDERVYHFPTEMIKKMVNFDYMSFFNRALDQCEEISEEDREQLRKIAQVKAKALANGTFECTDEVRRAIMTQLVCSRLDMLTWITPQSIETMDSFEVMEFLSKQPKDVIDKIKLDLSKSVYPYFKKVEIVVEEDAPYVTFYDDRVSLGTVLKEMMQQKMNSIRLEYMNKGLRVRFVKEPTSRAFSPDIAPAYVDTNVSSRMLSQFLKENARPRPSRRSFDPSF